MFGFFASLFGFGLYGIASIKKDVNTYKRKQNFYNKAIENGQPWYVDGNFQKRDIRTNRVLWLVTRNNVDYLCYYPTEEVFLNLTQWNIDKKNQEKRETSRRLGYLGYHKSMSEQDKKATFGNYNYNLIYCCTKFELDDLGQETGRIYETKTERRNDSVAYYIRFFNVKNHNFDEWIEITETEFNRRKI